jgi:hypothetical protein
MKAEWKQKGINMLEVHSVFLGLDLFPQIGTKLKQCSVGDASFADDNEN